jgi:hypothetical protein
MNQRQVITILDAILSEDGNALCADERYFNVYQDSLPTEFYQRSGIWFTDQIKADMIVREEKRYSVACLMKSIETLELLIDSTPIVDQVTHDRLHSVWSDLVKRADRE